MDLKTRDQKEGQHDVQHVFHSGWGATSDGARDNADHLRDEMARRGLQTDEKNWTVYSDPREWQVMKEKGFLPGTPPTALAAARHMADNTMAYMPTMWHGHSQGGAQITTAGNMAADILAGKDRIREKAESYARKHAGYRDDQDVPEHIVDGIAHDKAEARLAKYNMFSYSGAAMYPPEWATEATFSKKKGDPVSSAVAAGTPGPDWEDGPGRRKVTLDANMKNPFNRKYLQANITNHMYNANYAENDALQTERMLNRTQRLDAVPVQQAYPLSGAVNVFAGDGQSAGPRAGAALGAVKKAAWAPARMAGGLAKSGVGVGEEAYEMAKDSAKDGVKTIKNLGVGGYSLAKGLWNHFAD